MSIHDEIRYWQRRGQEELFQIFPVMPDQNPVRTLYGTKEINRLIVGPWEDEKEEIRCGRLWQDFDRFVLCKPTTVALHDPYPHKKPKFADTDVDPYELGLPRQIGRPWFGRIQGAGKEMQG